jgi:SP family general alpha glucoside:H+ symporter-like MFS transporter
LEPSSVTYLGGAFVPHAYLSVSPFTSRESELTDGRFFATTGPAYAAEVAPLALRGYLTAYVNLCWAVGQLISAGVLKGLVNNTTQWGYRIPFAVQWVWPVPLFIAALLAPESPWFLVRTGQLEKAKRSLTRLSEPEHNVDYDAAIALMVQTDKVEKEERSGVNLWDAFRVGTPLA